MGENGPNAGRATRHKDIPMLIDTLNWRYATKKMDPAHAVPEDKVDRILEAARLAPTSSGLQPFEIFVVTNPDLREKLREAAFDQAQLTDGSHVLVFVAWTNYSEARIDEIVEMSAEARGPSEALSGYWSRLPRDARVTVVLGPMFWEQKAKVPARFLREISDVLGDKRLRRLLVLLLAAERVATHSIEDARGGCPLDVSEV